MQENQVRQLYPIPEAAACLGIARTSLYALMAAGELESCKIGRRRLVTAKSIDAYVQRLTSAR